MNRIPETTRCSTPSNVLPDFSRVPGSWTEGDVQSPFSPEALEKQADAAPSQGSLELPQCPPSFGDVRGGLSKKSLLCGPSEDG